MAKLQDEGICDDTIIEKYAVEFSGARHVTRVMVEKSFGEISLGRRRNEYNTKEDVGELCQDLLH
jgi:hypothetical protein